jgi:hypothetical protein
MKREVSIIVPVIHKEKAEVCHAACIQNIGPGIEYELLFLEDADSIGCPKMVKKLVGISKYNNVCFLGDDCIPQPGFMDEGFKCLEEISHSGTGLMFFSDGLPQNRYNHFLASKSMLPMLDGEFFHTGYSHAFCDNELMERATEAKLCGWNKKALVLHDNPVLFQDPAEMYGSYEDVYGDKRMATDMILFGKRKANGWKTPGENYFKLAIGQPLKDDFVDKDFYISFVTMHKPTDWIFQLPEHKGQNLEQIRNSLVRKSIMDGCTHLIMMDTDQLYPPDTIERLLVNKDKAIVCTRVHRRWIPFDAILLRGEPFKVHHVPDEECFSGNLVSVDATGTGCMMIKLDIIKDMETPWFKVKSLWNGKHIGEDMYFCFNARKAGKEVYVDTSIEVGHMTKFIVNRSTYELFKAVRKLQWRPEDMPLETGDIEGIEDYKNLISVAKSKILLGG